MISKNFTVNKENRSVSARLYANDRRNVKEAVLYCHGFGGHKETRAAERFASKLLSKHPAAAVVTFDLPGHGEDARKTILLSDCDLYITLMLSYIEETFGAPAVYCYATSFGGYLVLKYIAEHGNPFRKIVLRAPAVYFYKVFTGTLLTQEDLEKIEKGKPVEAGFDRKVSIRKEFLTEILEADITANEYFDYADDILILQGTKDEVIPWEDTARFAEDQVIEFIPVENADHRFIDPNKMDTAIYTAITFLFG